ncbi:hypothetical protein niasHS_001156 [Heterodera schachtii]|uniref:Uncharacterized protein n=1 Tax=Heterodera schachtii TaxID=97005 RepID=A0ABD2KCB2_HETSC
MIIYILFFLAILVQEGSGDCVYRQCSCDEQNECFGVLIDETAKCFEVAYDEVKADLIKAHADPKKTAPCFDKFTNFVKDWLSCVNAKLVKQSSCLPTKSYVKITSNDFLEIFVKSVGENVAQRMDPLYALDNHTLVKLDQKWHDTAKVCAFDKQSKLSCFADKNCAVKASEKEVEKAVDECYMEHNVVNVQHKRCECMGNNVPCYGYGIENYCEKLKCQMLPDECSVCENLRSKFGGNY